MIEEASEIDKVWIRICALFRHDGIEAWKHACQR